MWKQMNNSTLNQVDRLVLCKSKSVLLLVQSLKLNWTMFWKDEHKVLAVNIALFWSTAIPAVSWTVIEISRGE